MTGATRRTMSGWRLLASAAWLLAAAASSPVGAESGPDPDAVGQSADVTASPRVAVEIGGASVVLVFANDRLHAFVDRLEDNAPVVDAQVTVTRDDAPPLTLAKAATGLFVAPLQASGRSQDVLTIALDSADGTGKRTATLVYERPKAATGAAALNLSASVVAVAVIFGLLGAAIAVLVMIAFQPQRRPAPRGVERQGAGGLG